MFSATRVPLRTPPVQTGSNFADFGAGDFEAGARGLGAEAGLH